MSALFLPKPVPEVVEFRPADWPEKFQSDQSAGRNSNNSGTALVRINRGLSALEAGNSASWVSEDGEMLFLQFFPLLCSPLVLAWSKARS